MKNVFKIILAVFLSYLALVLLTVLLIFPGAGMLFGSEAFYAGYLILGALTGFAAWFLAKRCGKGIAISFCTVTALCFTLIPGLLLISIPYSGAFPLSDGFNTFLNLAVMFGDFPAFSIIMYTSEGSIDGAEFSRVVMLFVPLLTYVGGLLGRLGTKKQSPCLPENKDFLTEA